MSGRILVAGAGAVGLCSAVRLAEAGFAVTLADPGGPNASAVAAGMLSPAFESAMEDVWLFPLLAEARDLWLSLSARHGMRLDRSGALGVGDEAVLDRWEAALTSVGAGARRLTAKEATRTQPSYTGGGGALFSREDWRLEPGDALGRLWQAAQRLGVEVRRQRVVSYADGLAVLEGSAPEPFDQLVAAVGFAPGLAPELAALIPIKGQIAFGQGVEFAGPAIRAEGVYVAPSWMGAVIGATMETGKSDLTVEPKAVNGLLSRAVKLVRSVGEGRFEFAAGIRAATPDGMPLVGRSAAEGVIVAAGARRNGWLLAPMIADEVTRAARGEEPGPHAARFLPGRFSGAPGR